MSQLAITWPRAGDILNRHDGTVTPQGLTVRVRGTAPRDATVSVACESGPEKSGPVQAIRAGDCFEAYVPLLGRRNDILVTTEQERISLPVLWDRDSQPRYRFSIDDNILFLKDLAFGEYRSLFDHWYLAFWRQMSRRYGTKVHFNIYYQADESVSPGGQFRLPQLPDRFKGEWRDNADWLRLTFHARQNKPDRPYKDAGYEEMARDFEAVTGEIARFAGEEVLSPFTTVHWAEATREGVRALRDRGIRGLIGLFAQRQSVPHTRYYLDEATADHIASRDYWWDPEMDMLFVGCDAVVNSLALGEVSPRLDEIGESAHTAELIELLIHEQYFRRELSIYQPDVQKKVVRSLEWVSARGYKPVFWGQGFIGA